MCHAVTNIVEVRCSSTDDAAENDDGIHFRVLNHAGCTEGEFHASRHIADNDVFFRIAFTLEYFQSTVAESVGDMAVPFGYDDTHFQILYFWKRGFGFVFSS